MDILSYKTARILQILVGNEIFKESEYVYDLHTQGLFKRKDCRQLSSIHQIHCPNGFEILANIPHTIPNRDSCLKLNKYNTSWRAFYEVNVGAATSQKDNRMSVSHSGNNLAEILANLWIDTANVDLTNYHTAVMVTNLIDYCYPGADVLSIEGEMVRYRYENTVFEKHKISLAKQAIIKFKATK